MAFSTISCSPGNTGKGKLSIYTTDGDEFSIKLISKYNDMYHSGIDDKKLSLNGQDGFSEKLWHDLLQGKGPDIIMCSPEDLPNLSVLIKKGVFIALDEMMKDGKFKDLNSKVLDYGMYEGKRYTLPLSFKLDVMYTTMDVINKVGIKKDSWCLLKDMPASAKAYKQENSNVYLAPDIKMSSLVQTAETPFFDIEKKKASFDSAKFIELLKDYKAALKEACPDKDARESMSSVNELYSDFGTGFFGMISADTGGLTYITEPYSSFKKEADPVIISAPSAGDKAHNVAIPNRIIAINSKCKNLESAFELVKLALSKEVQSTGSLYSFPTNMQAYKQLKESLFKDRKWSKGGCKQNSTIQKLFSQLDYMVNNIDRVSSLDTYILNMIDDKVKGYTEGAKSAEDIAKTIQESVDGYFKSGFVPVIYKETDKTSASKSSGKVSIYYWNMPYVEYASTIFKEKYPEIGLDITSFTLNGYEEFRNRVTTEVMAGVGPDVVIFNSQIYKSCFFKVISNALSKNIFCDLNELIAEDKEFKLSDYRGNILDYGVFDGKRFFIPLHYSFSPAVTTKSKLKENGITIDKNNWTWDYLAQLAREFMSKNKGKGKYLIAGVIDFNDMLLNYEAPFIDYKNKVSKFNSDEFKKFLRIYKDIYSSIAPEQDIRSYPNDSYVFDWGDQLHNPDLLKTKNSASIADTGESLELVPYPSFDGRGSICAQVFDCVAINSISKNKTDAFKFIKVLLLPELNSSHNSKGFYTDILGTVNKAAFDVDLQHNMKASVNPLTVNLAEIYTNMIDEMKVPCIRDYQVYVIANEAVKDYIAGKKNEEQTAKEIDEKVSLLLNE